MAALWQPMVEHRMRDIRCNNKRSVPPSAWRHLQPKSRPPLRKEQKKKKTLTHEKKYLLANPQSLADKTHRINTTSELEFCLSVVPFSPLYTSSSAKVKWRLHSAGDWLWSFRFNASCSCAKHGIYVLALPLMKMRSGCWELSQWILPTAFQTDLLMYGINTLSNWIYFT